MKILLVSKHQNDLDEFGEELRVLHDAIVQWVSTGKEAVDFSNKFQPDVVVAGSTLEDSSGLDFIKSFVKKHPMLNSALVSASPPDDFHEQTEGLGVFMQLPLSPGKTDVPAFVERLKTISHLMVQSETGASL